MPVLTQDRSFMEEVLGRERFASLPAILREFHNAPRPAIWSGSADIVTGTNPVARIMSRILRFPPGGREVRLTITIKRSGHPDGSLETWTRNFGGVCTVSHIKYEKRSGLSEAFGPVSCGVAPVIRDGGIEHTVISANLLGLPLPRFLLPKAEAREYTDDSGRFRFDIKLTLPLAGLLIHYRGWLMPGGEETSE